MNIPEMTPVESSNVAAVGHDAANTRLFVQFKGGAIYAYEGVDAEKFEAMKSAESVGKFLNADIKPFHPFQKV